MDNMDIALRATTTALGAQGSAVKENNTYMEGLQGGLDSLKTQVEKFFTSTSTQEFLSGLINALDAIMKGVNAVGKHIDILKAALIALVTIVVILKMELIVGFVAGIPTTIAAMATIVTSLYSIAASAIAATVATGSLRAGLAALAAGGLSPLIAVLSIAAFVIGGVMIATYAMTEADKKAAREKEELRLAEEKLLQENQKAIDTMNSEIEKVEKLHKEYDILKSKIAKTAEDLQQLSDIEQALIKIMPGLVQYYDAEGKAHLKNSESIELEIEAKKRLALEGQKVLKNQYLAKVGAAKGELTSISSERKELEENLAEYQSKPADWSYSYLDMENNKGWITEERKDLIAKTQTELAKLAAREKIVNDEMANGIKYVVASDDAYNSFALTTHNVANELINMIPKGTVGAAYEKAVSDITKKIQDLNLETKFNKYSDLTKQYSEGKITLEALTASYDDLFNTFQKLGLGEVIDKFIQLNETNLVFDTTTDEVKKSVQSLSDEVKDYNGVLVTLEKDETVAQETLVGLMQKYPEFAKEVTIVNGKLNIEHDVLVKLKKARIDDALEGIKKQLQLTDVTKTEIQRRLHNYGIEAKALGTQAERIKALNDAKKVYNEATTVMINGEKFNIKGSMPSGLGEQNPYVMDMNSVIGDLKEYNDAADYIEKLEKALLSSDPYYGTTPDKGEKEPPPKGSKTVNDKLAETDRYMELNLALERTNTLIAQNKALQENATIQQKIKLMRIEIELQKQKQRNLAAIAKEQREERGELVAYLTKNAGAKFKGSGDTMSIANAPAFLKAKAAEVNAFKDKESEIDQAYYVKIKQAYTILEGKVNRFNEIQVKGITDMQQQWMAALKTINDEIEKMRGLKIEMMFAPVLVDIADFEEAMKQIGFEEALAAKDPEKLAKVKGDKIALLTNEAMRLTTYLDAMNKVTDKATLADERFIKAKKDLINVCQQTATALIEETTAVEEQKKSSVEFTEKKIIEMIKKGLELKKKLLKDELDNYKEYVDDFLKEKDRQYADVDYKKDLNKETKNKQEIQAQIDALAGDTSIEAFQKVRELKKKLADQDEKIGDLREKRRRDVEKDNMKQSLTTKEKEFEDTTKLMDLMYSEEYIKKLAHETLVNQSFDRMRKQFPELFKQLGDAAKDGFFDTFEKYELSFGETIIGYAERFEKEILPKLQEAINTINGIKDEMGKIDQKINGVDYSKVVFDPNRNYAKDLEAMSIAGITPENNKDALALRTERNAKMYAEPEKYAAGIAALPEDQKKSVASTIVPESGKAISNLVQSVENDKITQPVFDPYTRLQKAQEIGKLEIGRLQRLWSSVKGKTKADDDLRASYKRDADAIRAKNDLGLQNAKTPYSTYKSYIPQASLDQLGVKVLAEFSKGIDNGLITENGLYMLHGSQAKPEWVFTNAQLMNLVKNLSSGVNLPSTNNPNIAGAGAGSGDINLNINIAGNADKETVDRIKDVGKGILLDIKKQLNKNGVYR